MQHDISPSNSRVRSHVYEFNTPESQSHPQVNNLPGRVLRITLQKRSKRLGMAGRTLYIVSKFEEMVHEVPDSPQQLIINEIEKSTQLVFPPTVPPRPLRPCRHRWFQRSHDKRARSKLHMWRGEGHRWGREMVILKGRGIWRGRGNGRLRGLILVARALSQPLFVQDRCCGCPNRSR